jgi:DNA repair exonuclease SbcCD ATPase subunit
VLDEPTASLDETNINSVVENFQEMRRYAQNAGLQIAVVTHHVELERAADQLVRL